jgi:alpha-beta hydrolase superfamily lysophospholipase
MPDHHSQGQGDARWVPDVLGRPFEQLTLPLTRDAEHDPEHDAVGQGRGAPAIRSGSALPPPNPVATLVRLRRAPVVAFDAPARGVDVLYVHGWSDYFFQRELAEFWHRQGARFFALDLRRYGRSLRSGQTPGFVTDLTTYDEEIGAALDTIGHGGEAPHGAGSPPAGFAASAGSVASAASAASAVSVASGGSERRPRSRRRLVLMGHSTGGLTLSLWAARHPGVASALVLNSPWLEFQTGPLGRDVIRPFVELHARVAPRGWMPAVDLGYYARSVAAEERGEWEYDHTWRPDRGFALHPAWLRGVLAGHERVAGGLGLDLPVLAMLSARSLISPVWSEGMLTSDVVLDVDRIAERATRLGSRVTVARFDGALHDITLSAEPVRAAAYAAVARWLPYSLG